ncbi:hypothetical protein [Paralysiella testudinis]|uniref:Uncharacterized protein n=1 Tax=Paralysiella testudinis TaxID=2809020 RepID=A0A892ZHL7_9NEIS|nr:hypothetical protein [Paralysiella testudinis]QRQ81236.1 hypothetical protein JQU52_10980 [Paralysiella testudinis]
MSQHKHPASAAARTLARYMDDILTAIQRNNGLIENTAANQTLIQALNQHALGYPAAELDGLILHSTVVRFVRHYESRFRFHQSSGNIALILDNIKEKAELYRFSCSRSSVDSLVFERELCDEISLLAEALLNICHHFSAQVYEEMATIADLEIRIRFNENQLAELQKLNDILGGLNNDKINELGSQDPDLEQLLRRILKPALDKCRRETIDAAHRLNAELLRWKKDLHSQQTNRLLENLLRHYQHHPHYRPDSNILQTAPEFFYTAQDHFSAYADLSDPDGHEIYADLAEKAAEKRLKATEPAPNQTVTEPVTIQAFDTVIETSSALIERIQWFFEALQQTNDSTSLSGIETYKQLQPPIDADTWLLMLTTHYRSHKDSFYPALTLHFHSETMPNYNGNRIVHDIVIERAA